MTRRPIRGFTEEDVFSPWRRLYIWTQRPGATSKVKRAYRRGERREAKKAIREGAE